MEKFLRDYVKMYAETGDIELDEDRLNEIVNNLMDNDELWDTFDSYVYEELKD